MRLLNTLKNDIRFQVKYGFYFLYAFFSAVYIVILRMTPAEYKSIVGSLIVLTDPAMLGIFFIGGIWLLEKGEGLHRFWCISPLRPVEYILGKSISLAALSMLSADLIVCVGMGSIHHFFYLSVSVFIGAIIFNLIGLIIATYARSVNHYMLIAILPSIFVSIPPLLTAFNLTHPVLEIFPGTALWHLIGNAMNTSLQMNGWLGINLSFWLVCLLFMANKRIEVALRSEGDEKI